MADFREDVEIYPILIALAEAVRKEIIESGLSEIGIVTVQPGALPVLDWVGNGKDCGEIIVNLTTAYPTQGFPVPDPAGTCGAEMAYEVQVAVYRCAPMMTGPKQSLKPPTPAAQLNSAREVLADMQAMRRAICKVLQGSNVYGLLPYQPYGPEGAAVGGAWTVTIGGKEED